MKLCEFIEENYESVEMKVYEAYCEAVKSNGRLSFDVYIFDDGDACYCVHDGLYLDYSAGEGHAYCLGTISAEVGCLGNFYNELSGDTDWDEVSSFFGSVA